MVAESVVENVREYLRACHEDGIPVSFGVLFGSHATGKNHEWSDIDLIVVSPLYDTKYTHNDVSRLWVLAGRAHHRIEPIPCGEKQWETDDGSVIIEVARREGRRIDLAEEPAVEPRRRRPRASKSRRSA